MIGEILMFLCGIGIGTCAALVWHEGTKMQRLHDEWDQTGTWEAIRERLRENPYRESDDFPT